MPTPGGLPKAGEVWEVTRKLPPDWEPMTQRFVVIKRGGGNYWPLWVYIPGVGRKLLVDMAYSFRHNEMKYIGRANLKTRKLLGLS